MLTASAGSLRQRTWQNFKISPSSPTEWGISSSAAIMLWSRGTSVSPHRSLEFRLVHWMHLQAEFANWDTIVLQ